MDSQCLFYSLRYFQFNKKSGLVVNGTVFTASPILKNNNKHNLDIYAHLFKTYFVSIAFCDRNINRFLLHGSLLRIS